MFADAFPVAGINEGEWNMDIEDSTEETASITNNEEEWNMDDEDSTAETASITYG